MWTVASDQFHCKHNGKTSNDQRLLYVIVLRVTSAMHIDEGRFVCVELSNIEVYSHTYFRRDILIRGRHIGVVLSISILAYLSS